MAVETSPLFVSTYVPDECGLATFTRDLADATDLASGRLVSNVVAIRKDERRLFYDDRVVHVIDNRRHDSYRAAALFCNGHPCDVVSIQHEYGLFSGEWGERILHLAEGCEKPLVTTFHTILTDPPPKARFIIRALAHFSRAVVVMAENGASLLVEDYGVDASKVHVIPHGVPEVGTPSKALVKQELGVASRKLVVTFGLISRGKGIEHMIRALPRVVARHPRALYLVVGRTHPEVKRLEGESYREMLGQLASDLGVAEHVSFVDRYPSTEEITGYLKAADVVVTPHVSYDQVVSGTLSYALAAGRAVVSTPYMYAEEMARQGVVLLAGFGDSRALAAQVNRVLDDRNLREELEERARRRGMTMIWPSVGRRYLLLFQDAMYGRTKRAPLGRRPVDPTRDPERRSRTAQGP